MHTKEEKTIEIFQHNIAYWYDTPVEPDEMSVCDIEHIEECIKQGYIEGELNDDGNRGWWRIDNLSPLEKAAPDLLAACEKTLEQAGLSVDSPCYVILSAAIAKAKGA